MLILQEMDEFAQQSTTDRIASQADDFSEQILNKTCQILAKIVMCGEE
jgi:hypothetical protein